MKPDSVEMEQVAKDFNTTIAIDGPAASGKTTVGQMLADHLSYLFLDTGCMYRAVTLAAIVRGIAVEDRLSVVRLARDLELDIRPVGGERDGRLYTVLLNGRDVTWDLRSNDVDSSVSEVSAFEGVRENLVRRQRKIASRGRVVVVGRDIGTVVIPEARLKLYIVASPEERAHRRWQEQKLRDPEASYEQILNDIVRRDKIDSMRQHSPMRPARDAIILDSTGRTPESVLEEILAMNYFTKRDD